MMHKLIYKISAILFMIFLSIILLGNPIMVSAKENIEVDYSYRIQNYDINVDVASNNVLAVTETITAFFYNAKHGIYRDIPMKNKLVHNIQGKAVITYNYPKITDLSVTDGLSGQDIPFEIDTHENNFRLIIGDSQKTISGSQTYVIQYLYALGYDGIHQYDEIYYNMIGNNWDTIVEQTSFTVNMPKTFEQDSIAFYTGYKGDSKQVNVLYEVSGTQITGRLTDELMSGEGLTIRMELPEGYFLVTRENNTLWYVLFTASMVVSILIFLLFGRGQKLLPIHVTYESIDLNPAEAGYINSGFSQDCHAISLLYYWADKGFIKITSEKENKICLTKLKESDETMKSYEVFFYEKIFEGRDQVTAEAIKDKMSGVVSQTLKDMVKTFHHPTRMIYTKRSKVARTISYIITGLCMSVCILKSIIGYPYTTEAYAGNLILLIWSFLFTILVAMIMGYSSMNGRSDSKAGKICAILFWMFVVAFFIMWMAKEVSNEKLIIYYGGIATGICGIAAAFTRERTKQGNEWISKIISLKQFMKRVDRDKLDTLLREYPHLYSHVLPYAYSFMLLVDWSLRFGGIEFKTPVWYSSNGYLPYDTMMFTQIMKEGMNDFTSSMDSSVADGGGSSGGGSGGGGGGSW